MLRINIKTYNYLLLQKFLHKLNSFKNFKLSVNYIFLPSTYKSFVVKKSPHVFGRSKEKYYLKTYLCVVTVKYLRKKDLLNFFSFLKTSNHKEGLGLKFTFYK
jgi:ribosomal protein S10